MHTGQVILALVILLPLLALLARTAGKARRARGPQGRPRGARGAGPFSGIAQRRHERRMEQARHENQQARDAQRHRQRLAEQAARAGGQYEEPGGHEDPSPGPRHTVRGTVIRIWDNMQPPRQDGDAASGDGGRGGSSPPEEEARLPRLRLPRLPRPRLPRLRLPRLRRRQGDGWGEDDEGDGDGRAAGAGGAGKSAPPAPPPPVTPPAPPPRAQRPAGESSQDPTIQGVVVTVQPDSPGALSVPGVEPIIDGARQLYAHAMSGNARSKRRALLGASAALQELNRMLKTLSAAMGEPGQHYGHEITEPIAMAGTHCTAAATAITEIDGRLQAVIRAMEELQASGVQAPHHEQLTAQ